MRHAYVLYDAQMCQVFLSESHPEACALYRRIVLHKTLKLLMIEQIRLAASDIGIGESAVYLEHRW